MVILIDADSTLINTHQGVLDLYRETTGDYSTAIDKNSPWDVSSICPRWNTRQVRGVFKNPKLFKKIQPIDGAVEVTKRLVKEGHRVVILTIHRHEGISNKGKMLKRLFPHIKEVIYISSINKKVVKDLVVGDILIDDVIGNLESSSTQAKLCFGDYEWNRSYEGLHPQTWEEVYQIVQFINKYKGLYDINE